MYVFVFILVLVSGSVFEYVSCFSFFVTANRGSPESVGSLSPGSESLVYGDTSIVSPQKRIHRRYL